LVGFLTPVAERVKQPLRRWRKRRYWQHFWADDEATAFWLFESAQKPVIEAVQEGWIAAGAKVLDLGCGLGQTSAFLSSVGCDVLGVDISVAAIRRAGQSYAGRTGLRFLLGDVTQPAPFGGVFDVIVDCGCLHCLTMGDRQQYVRNVVAWSRAGTKFLLLIRQQSKDPPAARRSEIETLFGPYYSIVSEDLVSDIESRAPASIAVTMFRLIRNG
jgi:cyclopropane fatty-acyl-phospholipid synthase-like methyltransferase